MEINDYTRFERARVLGARSLQISMGAPPLLEGSEDRLDPLTIALEELETGVIPITPRRNYVDVN